MIALTVLFVLLLLVVALTGAGSMIASEPVRRLLGGILLAVGILVMTGSGLCSLAVMLSVIGSGDPGALFPVLLFGGLPFAGGFGLFWRGRGLIRSTRPPSDDELRQRFD